MVLNVQGAKVNSKEASLLTMLRHFSRVFTSDVNRLQYFHFFLSQQN